MISLSKADILPESPGVYVIFLTHNPSTVYVGSSKNIRKRIKQHYSALKRGKHGNWKLQSLFHRYKDRGFRVQVLEKTKDEATSRIREQLYIDFLPHTYNLDNQVVRYNG